MSEIGAKFHIRVILKPEANGVGGGMVSKRENSDNRSTHTAVPKHECLADIPRTPQRRVRGKIMGDGVNV